MSRITIELLRKRVEHNEGEIQSVEELALHQEKIEKLENLDKWCRKLKILLLQNNLISKIENVNRLKELEYLNLALNNVEKIENLEGCESLRKLDLTLNFIGEVTSVLNLQQNHCLENLYLTGNPCSDYPGYRKYVINCLPQLKSLDGTDITMTEKLIARQEFQTIERDILFAEAEYKARRELEKQSYVEDLGSSDEETIDNDEYWNKVTPNTPEVRKEMTLRSMKLEEKSKEAKGNLNPEKKKRKEISLFYSDGRPKNINQAKVTFSLQDQDDKNILTLDLALPKYMDSSLIDADVQPTYIKIVIKGKIFQIVLPEEVKPDASSAQRSKTTGHLLITMPKLQQSSKSRKGSLDAKTTGTINNAVDSSRILKKATKQAETCDTASTNPDWRNIVPEKKGESSGKDGESDSTLLNKGDGDKPLPGGPGHNSKSHSKPNSQGEFVDDAEVPPLI